MRLLSDQYDVGISSTFNVEVSSIRAHRDTYVVKLFATPVACGLLTGVLAGGVTIWWQLLAKGNQEPTPGLDFVLDYLAMLCLCSGAVLCRRKARMIPPLLGLAVIATCLDLSIEWMELYGHVTWTLTADPFVAYSISSAMSGAFLGLVLAASYGCWHLVKSCMALSVAGQLLTFLVLYFQEQAGRQGGTEQAALWFMPILLVYMVSATLPVLAIDRERRARIREV